MIDNMNGLRVDGYPRQKNANFSQKCFTLGLLLERGKIALVNTEPVMTGS